MKGIQKKSSARRNSSVKLRSQSFIRLMEVQGRSHQIQRYSKMKGLKMEEKRQKKGIKFILLKNREHYQPIGYFSPQYRKQKLTPLHQQQQHLSSKVTFQARPYAYSKAKLAGNLGIELNLTQQTNNDVKKLIQNNNGAKTERRNIRKNRFERIESPDVSERNQMKESQQNVNEDQYNNQKNIKSNRRYIQKSIGKIEQTLFSKVDTYFDQIETIDIPSSKIQIYTSVMGQPSAQSHHLSYRSNIDEQLCNYGFEFEFREEKVKKKGEERK